MACKRNRVLDLKQYLVSLGIDINIAKNKARGHKGIFMHRFDNFRIDISKNLDDENVLSVLLHEFAHYVHYLNDSSLKSLDFVFGNMSDEIREELIRVTVSDVPKDFAASLYEKKHVISAQIKQLSANIKQKYPDFRITEPNKKLEKCFSGPLKYLLKYDRVNVFGRIYSVDKLEDDFVIDEDQRDYIRLKSNQRVLRRINSRINKLNKYYNNPSELFARFVEKYYTKPDTVKRLAPIAYSMMQKTAVPQLVKLNSIINE